MAENKADFPNNISCPQQLFGYDLKQFIEENMGLGHNLLVCGDFNSDYTKLINGCLT